jgi:arginine repressor
VAGIIAGTKSILTIASQNEQAKISFETLLKSGEEAKQMLIDI